MLINMLGWNIKDKQLKIFYFFINADGQCSESEMEKFDSICKGFKVSDERIAKAIEYCKTVDIKNDEDNSEAIIKEIDNMLGFSEGSLKKWAPTTILGGNINTNKKAQIFTIWTLINLGYADEEYSEPEKKIVEFLIKNWKMDKDIIALMDDTIEAIKALTEQKEWISSSDREDKNELLDQIEEDIKRMYSNIEITVFEADIKK